MFTVNEQLQILQESDYKCAHCGKRLSIRKDSGFTIEHAIPLHKGGTNEHRNLIALCKECNTQKSDDIVQPNKFYPYLPKKKLNELNELFDKYMKTIDWLSGDNLFQYDQFDIRLMFPVVKPGLRNLIMMNGTAHVSKMRPEDAFEWLYAYTARLSTGDKDLMVKQASEIQHPYYRITYNNKDLLIFSTHIDKPNWKDPDDGSAYAERVKKENQRNSIQIEVFVNPDIKDNGRYTSIMLFSAIYAIHKEIHMTLYNSRPGSVIEFQTHSPHSDTKAMDAYEVAVMSSKGAYQSYATQEKTDSADGYIQGISGVFYQGTSAEMATFVKSHGYKNMREMAKSDEFVDIESRLNAMLNEPLSQHTTRPKPQPKPAPHKNHAKKAARARKKKK